MRTSLPQFVLGYHGCDFSLVQQLLKADTELKFSENSYDWLGHGIYFWENAPYRAFEWAEEAAKNPKKVNGNISTPAVIGAVIDLGNCFDLSDTKHIDVVREAYNGVVALCKKSGEELPKNTAYCRDLDCKVINMAVELNERLGYLPFDSVRSPFFEGDKLYSGAYFQAKTHIQICIRKSECIKGYFLPKDFLKKLTG